MVTPDEIYAGLYERLHTINDIEIEQGLIPELVDLDHPLLAQVVDYLVAEELGRDGEESFDLALTIGFWIYQWERSK